MTTERESLVTIDLLVDTNYTLPLQRLRNLGVYEFNPTYERTSALGDVIYNYQLIAYERQLSAIKQELRNMPQIKTWRVNTEIT